MAVFISIKSEAKKKFAETSVSNSMRTLLNDSENFIRLQYESLLLLRSSIHQFFLLTILNQYEFEVFHIESEINAHAYWRRPNTDSILYTIPIIQIEYLL